MNLQQRYDVIINGGGFIGLALAIALARNGIQVLLIEKSRMPVQLESTFDGRVSAIALGSKNILNNIDAWKYMEPHAEPINDIRVSDGNTPFFLHYAHQEISEGTGGAPFGYIVENRYIRHGLQQAASKLPDLHILEEAYIKHFSVDGVLISVSTNKDKVFEAQLLIGADGKYSAIRNMAGIKDIKWEYNQTAIVCTIRHEKPHHGLAQERFLRAGPFAVLPMTANRSSLVWVEPNDRVQLYLELPNEEFVQEIEERVGGYLGKIEVEGSRFSYPLSLMHAKDYVATRVALIGDAAHAIHPIAGQGVNLGFRDVAVLSELLVKQFARKQDLAAEELLSHYQRWRRFDNVTMLAVTDMLNKLFSNNILPIQIARGLGLWAVGQAKPLKKFFMKHAMGLVGDVPNLSK